MKTKNDLDRVTAEKFKFVGMETVSHKNGTYKLKHERSEICVAVNTNRQGIRSVVLEDGTVLIGSCSLEDGAVAIRRYVLHAEAQAGMHRFFRVGEELLRVKLDGFDPVTGIGGFACLRNPNGASRLKHEMAFDLLVEVELFAFDRKANETVRLERALDAVDRYESSVILARAKNLDAAAGFLTVTDPDIKVSRGNVSFNARNRVFVFNTTETGSSLGRR